MITLFDDYTSNQNLSPQPIDEVEKTIQEYIGIFQRRVFILESYWEPHIFNNKSVYPFISSLKDLITEDVVVGHRFFDSSESFKNYLKYPGGLIWQFPETFATTVFMFESHATPNEMTLPLNNVSRSEIIENCRGFYQFPNILVFGGCGLFNGKEGKKFGNSLVRESGSKGVFGFSGTQVSFIAGTIIEILLLSHLFLFEDGDPFNNLTEIFERVIRDFPLAATEEVGFTLFQE